MPSKSSDRSEPAIEVVLVGTDDPLNLGAVARAMRNCELGSLTLVAPKTDDFVTARRVAVHATDLLQAPRTAADLREALADSTWSLGTTSRALPGRPALSPREAAREAVRRLTHGPIALVFGGEESGLSNEHLARCAALSTIPGGARQPSYNLAQSVLLYLYELRVALDEAAPTAAPAAAPAAPGRARERELGLVEDALRAALQAAHFADPDRPRHGVLELVQTLRRAGLTHDEAALWHAALRVLARAHEERKR